LLAAAATLAAAPGPAAAGGAWTGLRVGILESASLPAYDRPVATFREDLAAALPGVEIEQYDMGGDRARGEGIQDLHLQASAQGRPLQRGPLRGHLHT